MPKKPLNDCTVIKNAQMVHEYPVRSNIMQSIFAHFNLELQVKGKEMALRMKDNSEC